MPGSPSRKPSWADVKSKLAACDRPSLLHLIRDLYAANKENQRFLHARFGLGEDPLGPYKTVISQWMSPDPFGREFPSATKAKQAITEYGKAAGSPGGLAELMVLFCEEGADFAAGTGYQDEAYLNAIVTMFGQALQTVAGLPAPVHDRLCARLKKVRDRTRRIGYGAGDAIDDMFRLYAGPRDE